MVQTVTDKCEYTIEITSDSYIGKQCSRSSTDETTVKGKKFTVSVDLTKVKTCIQNVDDS